MWGMSVGEFLTVIAIVLVILGVFVAVIFVIAKKESASLEDLLASIPEEYKEAVKAEPYQPMDGAGIKCATRGLIGSIDTNGEKSKVRLVFYNEAREGFYDQTTTIRTSELNGKGLKLYDLVPCQMKYDKEYHIHEFKKIM
ncbi:MAG: hypothetical protein IK081_02745 [Lachnospiraceae bacterium]|jgi:hypothetical protein|nr:hypothetical protein [Lachnospiraceae bacterium]MBR4731664.1 hypothetical protein [Lachnospiraceae bacterium]